ncbi:hypothetical protein Tco_0282593 [Tanacetum coccineum]
MKSVSIKHRLLGKKSLKPKWMQKESVSKQGRKPTKAEPTVHKDPAFDDLDDAIDYMEERMLKMRGGQAMWCLKRRKVQKRELALKRFLAQQRVAAIRSKPPTRTQLRNQMMTYLKHVGGKKHADLKNKNFEEIQVLYKKVKRSDKDFIAIGSARG